MQERIFNQILDVIEHPSFIERTYIASNYQLVAELIRRTPEVKFLVKHKDTSFPFILARYQEEKEIMAHEVYLVYFVIFGTYQNPAAIPELISYLISCRVGPGKSALHFFPWDPFLHAAEALAILTHDQISVPTQEEIEDNIDGFFERMKQWIVGSGETRVDVVK